MSHYYLYETLKTPSASSRLAGHSVGPVEIGLCRKLRLW